MLSLRPPVPSSAFLLFLLAALLPLAMLGQVPDKCFEIEGFLVDACNPIAQCPGSSEGQNEMFRFRTGGDPLALADIAVQWPNNPWRGFVQNATTAALTLELNATIEGCGLLLEPPAGIVPPGSTVIVVTSTEMCTAGNSFAALADTVYLTFQAPGNTLGHFANHNNGPEVVPAPIGGVSTRTLIMTHLPTLCGDTATYDRQELVNIQGSYGGPAALNDGATALFSWPGVPVVSYVNFGCLAPYEPLLVSATAASPVACAGDTIAVQGNAQGGFTTVFWQGGLGTFIDPNEPSTGYVPAAGESGMVTLSYCAVGACGLPVCGDVTIEVAEAPFVSIIGDAEACVGNSIVLTAVGGGALLWSTGSADTNITVTDPGTYSVSASTGCGTAQAAITVAFVEAPQAAILGELFACPQTVLTASGDGAYLWSTGSTDASIVVSEPGIYTLVVTNACGTSDAFVEVLENPLTAAFQPSTFSGEAPLTVSYANLSTPADAVFSWDLGDGTSSLSTAPTHTYTQPGSYTVTLTASMGACSASNTATITVGEANTGEVGIRVPNVFSPNGDGVNDVLEVFTTGITALDMRIYNRWGQLVARLEGVGRTWDGRTMAGMGVPDGTYYYELRATGSNGSVYDLQGALTVLR